MQAADKRIFAATARSPPPPPLRKDGRVIIHFDYDCFYAAVIEHAQPALKHLPLAVQQKQIIVTCNYEARRRGLYKLQLVREARRLCPDVVIVLGEDISRFRDASKALYRFLKRFSWSGRVERLGFDEVWMDVSDIVEWNVDVLNWGTLGSAFFQLKREDPTVGFAFDARVFAGHTYPEAAAVSAGQDAQAQVADLQLRLRLGSHLAMYLRHRLEDEMGYTATNGIATSKLVSKLVGSLHKPKGQTTIVPPYEGPESNIIAFMDGHDIGKVPGIGYKLSQKLREFVLRRPAAMEAGLVTNRTRESVTVRDVRLHPDVNPESLEKLLGGPGSPHGIGVKVWQLLHGIDDTEVALARQVPKQISLEDSYVRLDTYPEVVKELRSLSCSLITRMRIDLTTSADSDDEDDFENNDQPDGAEPTAPQPPDQAPRKWLAHPKTLRLSTRPRAPLNNDGTRPRTFKRISHSAPLPTFIFNLSDSVSALAEKLVQDTLLQMFRKLHPEKGGWNLSLVNVAVTGMVEVGGRTRTAGGRDIGGMFRRQEDVLREFRVVDCEGEKEAPAYQPPPKVSLSGPTEDRPQKLAGRTLLEDSENVEGEEDDEVVSAAAGVCKTCGIAVPAFALLAHRTFHETSDV